MLVIRRRAGESIFIADDVEIEVLEITPTRVKLGIKAPKEVPVLRKEVRLTQDHNRAAAQEISLHLLTPLLSHLRVKP
ncbi:MAG: carbon storage regulator [Acidobacteriia bacterium]|nr:carbon storage regulator [Terriglobia bacterium]